MIVPLPRWLVFLLRWLFFFPDDNFWQMIERLTRKEENLAYFKHLNTCMMQPSPKHTKNTTNQIKMQSTCCEGWSERGGNEMNPSERNETVNEVLCRRKKKGNGRTITYLFIWVISTWGQKWHSTFEGSKNSTFSLLKLPKIKSPVFQITLVYECTSDKEVLW